MAAGSHIGFIWVILDYLRSAIVGQSLILKFGLDRICSFWDIAIFIFRFFWLEIAYSRPFLGVWGHISPRWCLPSS